MIRVKIQVYTNQRANKIKEALFEDVLVNNTLRDRMWKLIFLKKLPNKYKSADKIY